MHLLERPKSKTLSTPNAEQKGTLICCGWERKMAQPPWKTVWLFLIKLNILSPGDPTVVLLGEQSFS